MKRADDHDHDDGSAFDLSAGARLWTDQQERNTAVLADVVRIFGEAAAFFEFLVPSIAFAETEEQAAVFVIVAILNDGMQKDTAMEILLRGGVLQIFQLEDLREIDDEGNSLFFSEDDRLLIQRIISFVNACPRHDP